MTTRRVEIVEGLVWCLTALSGIYFILDKFGLEPLPYSGCALFLLVASTLAQAAWRLFGKDAWRSTIRSQLIGNDLNSAVVEMGKIAGGEVRACILRPRGRCRKSLVVVYSSGNMLTAPGRGIRLEKWQGCAGKAWGHNKPVAADLTVETREGGPDWSMTPELLDLTKDIKAVMCYPIRLPENGSRLFGILSFDSAHCLHAALSSPDGQEKADAKAISAMILASR